MREIKFRAWDKENSVMRYNAEQAYNGHWQMNDIQYFGQLIGNEKYELMQYTGLKDKNGKEIYEGDYLRVRLVHDEYEDFIVMWEQFSAGFALLDAHGTEWNFTESNEYEVIGNIYENKELLHDTE